MNNNKFIYDKILIFDGSNCLHRAITEPHLCELEYNGSKTGGVFGVLQIIIKEFKLYNYYPIVVFDGNLSARRLNIFPNYKHHLDKRIVSCETLEEEIFDDIVSCETNNTKNEKNVSCETFENQNLISEYARQRDILIQILPLIGIPVIRLENWEGDDIIAYLTSISYNAIVVSEDRDLYQLISDNPAQCRIKHGMKNQMVDYKTLIKEHSTTPKQFMINKCLLGDVSDNIPSACPKIGPKSVHNLYKIYEYCILNNKSYPQTEEDLNTLCETLNLNKRQALLNFNEIQFLTNISLINLDTAIEELDASLKEHIQNIINATIRDKYLLNIQEFEYNLSNLNIKSFYINSILESLKSAESHLFYVDLQ